MSKHQAQAALELDQLTGEIDPGFSKPQQFPIRTMFNHVYIPDDDEVNNQPSQTVQDHNLSLKELVERSMRGQPIYGSIPIDFGSIHMPNFQAMDISEREDFKALMREQVDTLRQRVENQKREQSQQLPQTQNNQVNSGTPPPGEA